MSEIKKQFEKERDEKSESLRDRLANRQAQIGLETVKDAYRIGFTEGALNSSVTKMLERVLEDISFNLSTSIKQLGLEKIMPEHTLIEDRNKMTEALSLLAELRGER